MLEFWQGAGFMAVAVLVTLSPGPDNVMVIALGVGAAIAASPWAFPALTLAGGTHLVWLGIRAMGRRGGVAWQTVPLGLLFAVQAVLPFGTIGMCSGGLGGAIRRHPAAGAWLDRAAGGVFIALGLKLMAPS